MRNLLVAFSLYTLLVAATSAAETQGAEVGSVCQQENGRFNYEHPTTGKFNDLTQNGLELIRAESGESKTSVATASKCPEEKVSAVKRLKSWFKQLTNKTIDGAELYPNLTEEETALYVRMGGKVKGYWSGNPLENPVHLVKNGAFEAALYMTQDGEKILSGEVNNGDLKNSVSVTSGGQVEALLLFRGCSVNQDDKCLVTGDYVIEAPDGSIFHEQLNTDVWKEAVQSVRQLLLTNTRVGFLAPEDADTGTYTFRVRLYDKISSEELSLTGYVEVYKELPENSRKPESGV